MGRGQGLGSSHRAEYSPTSLLPRPTRGEADARPRAAGEGPNFLKIPGAHQDVRRARQSRRTNVPHPNPPPKWGEGILHLHNPLLPVLESTLLANRLIPALGLDPLYFPLPLALRRRLLIAPRPAPPPARLPVSARLRTPSAARRHDPDRSHRSVARRSRRDHRIVLQRQM